MFSNFSTQNMLFLQLQWAHSLLIHGIFAPNFGPNNRQGFRTSSSRKPEPCGPNFREERSRFRSSPSLRPPLVVGPNFLPFVSSFLIIPQFSEAGLQFFIVPQAFLDLIQVLLLWAATKFTWDAALENGL